MSEESIEYVIKSDSNFAPTFAGHHLLLNMNFNGHGSIKNNISITKTVINLYISYTQGPQLENLNIDFTLGNCLFGSVKLTKNADQDKYKYTGYWQSIWCSFRISIYRWKKYCFWSCMSSSVHADNKGKYILILGEGPTQRLDDMTLTAEAKYPINFTQSGKRFVLGLHHNGSNSFSFVNATKVYQFKAKTQKYKIMHCFGHVSKDFTIKSTKKTGLTGVVIFFFCWF